MHLPSRFKRRGPQFKMSGRTMKWRRDTYEPSQPSDRENSPEIFSLEWQDCDTHPILDLVVVCPPPDKGGGQPLKFPTPNDALLCIGWHKSHAEKLMKLASRLVWSRLRGRRDIMQRWRNLPIHKHAVQGAVIPLLQRQMDGLMDCGDCECGSALCVCARHAKRALKAEV